MSLKGALSDLHDIKSGIPQGSVLGPTLFTLCTSDLPAAVTSVEVYMYADNTTVLEAQSTLLHYS